MSLTICMSEMVVDVTYVMQILVLSIRQSLSRKLPAFSALGLYDQIQRSIELPLQTANVVLCISLSCSWQRPVFCFTICTSRRLDLGSSSILSFLRVFTFTSRSSNSREPLRRSNLVFLESLLSRRTFLEVEIFGERLLECFRELAVVFVVRLFELCGLAHDNGGPGEDEGADDLGG